MKIHLDQYYIADSDSGVILHGPYKNKGTAQTFGAIEYGHQWQMRSPYGVFSGQYCQDYGYKLTEVEYTSPRNGVLIKIMAPLFTSCHWIEDYLAMIDTVYEQVDAKSIINGWTFEHAMLQVLLDLHWIPVIIIEHQEAIIKKLRG